MAEAAHPEANIIFGAVIDDTLGDEVRVTVIAAGFDSGQLPYKKVDIRREAAAASRPLLPPVGSTPIPSADLPPRADTQPERPLPPPPNGQRTPISLDDELDVPYFLKS